MSDVAKHVAEVSESRSEGLSTQRFSEVSGSGLTGKETKNVLIFSPKSTSFSEALGKALLFWLPMLYYEGSSLNDRSFPSGIETARTYQPQK